MSGDGRTMRRKEALAARVRAPESASSIWRYVEFWKYADLLSRSALWFARATELGDEFEGSLPAIAEESALRPDIAEQLGRWRRNLRYACYVNCWNTSEVESVALWVQYGMRNSVAIRSTVQRLDESLGDWDPPIKIGAVEYIDYATPEPRDPNQLETYYFRKRRSFEHEREVRGWTHYLNRGKFTLEEPPATPVGVHVPVDLGRLVERVHVSPRASDGFLLAVENLTRQYGRSWDIKRSSLDAPAIF